MIRFVFKCPACGERDVSESEFRAKLDPASLTKLDERAPPSPPSAGEPIDQPDSIAMVVFQKYCPTCHPEEDFHSGTLCFSGPGNPKFN